MHKFTSADCDQLVTSSAQHI